ncbi:hypothetical protein [Bradyrhizobium jicamae]|uniref:hypothetical protein n=1 Tax=Bradyrhizobium jicamae TaxID=280332 RepID=UPI002011D360|nr:hypothetical protein [Bradyrhizobium jicamae]
MARRCVLALRCILAFATFASAAFTATSPAQSRQLVPVIPPEIGVGAPLPYVVIPYRCSAGPVQNFYHGALYREPPAAYLDFAYRPYYRYTAARVVPRSYACAVVE